MILDDPERFIDRAIELLREIPREEANSSLLGSFLAGLETRGRELVDATLDRLTQEDEEIPDLAQITTYVKIRPGDLARVCSRFKSGRQPIDRVVTFAYGSVLKHLEPGDIKPLLDALVEVGGSALSVALEIGMMYARGDAQRFGDLREPLRRIVLAGGLLDEKKQPL